MLAFSERLVRPLARRWDPGFNSRINSEDSRRFREDSRRFREDWVRELQRVRSGIHHAD